MSSEVEVAVVSASADDPRLSVKLLRGFVVGARYCEPGEVVSLPRDHAMEAYRRGIVVPSGFLASAVLLAVKLFSAPAPKSPAALVGMGQLVRVKEGSFFDGPQGRTFGPEDGVVSVYSPIPLECLVESQPAPDSGERRARTVIELQLPPEQIALVVAQKKKAAAGRPAVVGVTGCAVTRDYDASRPG